MKLNNTLIVTLPDFARHFTFAEFWANRRQFVRDMHPSRVYYWSSELAEAYAVVAAWIDKGETATDNDREAGCKALETLVGKSVSFKSLGVSEDEYDWSQPVISVPAGKTLHLPVYHGGTKDRRHLGCHKIEVVGKPGGKATVCMGSDHVGLAVGDFVYATAVEGFGFVEFLPKYMRNDNHELTLVSQNGEFGSSLVVKNLCNMHQEVTGGVVSFALTDDGYVYVTAGGKLIIMSNAVLGIKFALMHSCSVLCVKSRGNDVMALYTDGILKNTHSMDGIASVASAWFDEHGKLRTVRM